MTPCSPQGGRRMTAHLLAALAGGALLIPAGTATAAKAPAHKVSAHKVSAHKAPARKVSAAKAYHRADAAVVKAARSVVACRRKTHSRKACATRQRKLQIAGLRLSRLQRTVKARKARARVASVSSKSAPTLSAYGYKLTWSKVGRVGTYVVVRKVAGLQDQYSVVTGTSTTPATLPGKTAAYAVRTAVVGSSWSRNVSISYPAPAPTTDTTSGTTAEKPTDAPVMWVDGQTVRWNKVAGVDSYVYVVQIPGVTDVYHRITGTSLTPDPVPGQTVKVGLRTDVEGSTWAKQVTITYPAQTTTTTVPTTTTTTTSAPAPAPTTTTTSPAPAPPTTTTTTTTAPATRSFTSGVVLGSAAVWELPFAKQLGAKAARMEFDINTPAADLASAVDAYAKAGMQPLLLAGFQGRVPTAAEADNLATWAAAYGPGGTFWAGKGYPASVAVTRIEFGNETNQAWQYSSLASDPSWAMTSTYANIAQGYARAFKEAAVRIKATNPNVGLLAVGDAPGNWPQWMNNVFAAVPNFGDYVAGWTMHPYGPQSRWQPNMDNALSQIAAHNAPSTTPIYVTEYGLATDNGRCLDDNYGWDKCMTYDQAGSSLTSSVAAMRSRYGSRLAAMYLYQAHDQKSSGTSTSRESYFGGLTLSGTAKGGYTSAIMSLLSA